MFFRNLLLNLLLAVGALALVAGTAIVVLRMMHSSDVERAREAQKPAILVATHTIQSGSILRSDDFAWNETDSASLSAGYLVRGRVALSDYSGAVVRRAFASGEPLVAGDIVKPDERGFLAAVLSPGDRAVTITVGPSESASGLVLPGDYVDVILTQNFDSYTTDPARKTVGETVLHNVRVIAVDQKLTSAPSAPAQPSTGLGFGATQPSSSLRLPKTITLEVNEQQAQRLMVASSLGHIDLALRALQTSSAAPQPAEPTWASDVSPALRELTHRAPAPAAKGGGPAPVATVRILRGSKSEAQ
jgi:pilus assembly protein CpaB